MEENAIQSKNFLSNIYNSLTIKEDEFFDIKNDLKIIENAISQHFNSSFLLIETNELQNNEMLLNNNFVILFKICSTKYKIKKIGLIFIGFCDYFDLSYNKTYNLMHKKIQDLININAENICGKDVYNKEKIKNSRKDNIIIKSLFDLIKK